MSEDGPVKKHQTNPYINLDDLGVSKDERITEGLFKEIVSQALEKNLSTYEKVVFVSRSPLSEVKALCRERLHEVPEAHLGNKDIMYTMLRNLFDEVANILLQPQSEEFYRIYANQVFNHNPDTSAFEEAVVRLRDEDLQVAISLLGDVAGSVRAREMFYDYAKKQKVQPRGRTMVDGLKPAEAEELPDSIPPEPMSDKPTTKKNLFRIEHPEKKKKKRRMKKGVSSTHVDTKTDGLFVGPPANVDIPKMPIYAPRTREEQEILFQGSTDPDSVRFTPEPTIDQVQSESSLDAEIVATLHEIEDEPTMDLSQTLPAVSTSEEEEMRPTLPDAPESIRSASGKGEHEIEDEDTWIQEPAVEPEPVAPPSRPKLESQPIIPVGDVKEEKDVPSTKKPLVFSQPTSKRTGDLRAHVPPMRPPMASESKYRQDEPKIMVDGAINKQFSNEGIIEETLGKLPEGNSAEDTKRLTTAPRSKKKERGNRIWAIALAALTGLGVAVTAKRFYSPDTTDALESSRTPAPPAPSPTMAPTTVPSPAPVPTTSPRPNPEPKPMPGPAPDPKPVTVPHKTAEFDASSIDPKNVLLKTLVEDGNFTLKMNAGVNGQFLALATNGANAEQAKQIAALNKKISIGVYAVAMKKFGSLSPQQIQEIKSDATHPDHGFLVSSLAISKKYNQSWSPKVRVMQKNPDGTAVYDRFGKPIFEVKDYWDAHKEAYEYGLKFVNEMGAKGYGNIHNVGKPGDVVTIEEVTYFADILDIMAVRRKSAGGATGLHTPGKKGKVQSHDKKDGAPQKENNDGGKQGFFQPQPFNLDPQLHEHKSPTFIEPDQAPDHDAAPSKHAKNEFTTETPPDAKFAQKASHRVDMSFLEKDPAKKFDNLFRLNRKIRVKNGETFWSAMEKSVADSGESMFVRAAVEGVLNRWKGHGVDQLPFSVAQQTGDGLILQIDHPDFAEEMSKSLAKARKMDAATAKRRGEVSPKAPTPAEKAAERREDLAVGPLYLSAVYRPAQGVRPKDLLIGDIQRSKLSPFVEGAVMRQLDRIQGAPFTIRDIKNREYGLKPAVKRQLELAAKLAMHREQKGLGNANVDMSFARPKPAEPLKYGAVEEMNGVPTNMDVPLKWHPVQYLEHTLVEKLQARRKVLADNPNNMELIGRLMNAEHQVKAKCAGMRRMGLRECVKMYVPAQQGRPTKVVWKSTTVDSLARIMNPLFEKPEVSLNGVQKDPSRPASKRPLPVPEYKKRMAKVPKRPLPVPRRYRSPSSTPRPVDRVA